MVLYLAILIVILLVVFVLSGIFHQVNDLIFAALFTLNVMLLIIVLSKLLEQHFTALVALANSARSVL
jgi:hypothetical protein